MRKMTVIGYGDLDVVLSLADEKDGKRDFTVQNERTNTELARGYVEPGQNLVAYATPLQPVLAGAVFRTFKMHKVIAI